MANVFEIKKVDAELRVNGHRYKFVDPKFLDKVHLKKIWDDFDKNSPNLSEIERITELHELNKKQIKLYIPDLENKELDEMGDQEFMMVLQAISEAAEHRFGASVEQTEKK